jgi:hypothetical protein
LSWLVLEVERQGQNEREHRPVRETERDHPRIGSLWSEHDAGHPDEEDRRHRD